MALFILNVINSNVVYYYCTICRLCNVYFVSYFAAREMLPLWDKQIQSICFQVNGIIEKIGAAEPNWMTRALDEQMSH